MAAIPLTDSRLEDDMTQKIIECLDQLTALLIAANKCQPGQVAHKVTVAKQQLANLALEARNIPAAIPLGNNPFTGTECRVVDGRVQYLHQEKWETCLRWPDEAERNPDFRAWVGKQLLAIAGLTPTDVTPTVTPPTNGELTRLKQECAVLEERLRLIKSFVDTH